MTATTTLRQHNLHKLDSCEHGSAIQCLRDNGENYNHQQQREQDSTANNKRRKLMPKRATLTTMTSETSNNQNNNESSTSNSRNKHNHTRNNRKFLYSTAKAAAAPSATLNSATTTTTTTMMPPTTINGISGTTMANTIPVTKSCTHASTCPGSFTSSATSTTNTSATYTSIALPQGAGMLTSFLLNSTLLALNNATTTTATAISAVATVGSAAATVAAITNLGLISNGTTTVGNMSSTDLGASASGGVVVAATGSISAVNGDISLNDSDDLTDDETEYIFDRTDVRIIFITLYTLVFCCCFFGNLLVILVVTLSRRLRSITNFFLANLALADFCVGLFCVMQNLSIYLIDSWVFGEFLCRMYQFVHSLSYTASIFILVVICMERYFAIVHPITCKQILTAARLRMVILTVWITSAVYSTPKFVFSKTIKNIHTEDGQEEEICVLDRKMFNSKLLDMINFVLLYVIPLLVMTVLYSKIAIALWRSSRGLSHHIASQQQDNNSMGMHNSMYHNHHSHNHNHAHHQMQQQPPGTPISGSGGMLSRKQSSKYEKRAALGVGITESQHDNCQVSLDSDRPIVSACRKTSFYHHPHQGAPRHGAAPRVTHMSHSSSNVLRARRGVVRMLIIFVLTFALCNLPYHARKMWQYWSRSYRGDSNFNALLTPLTFLVTYFNSGVNPLLYAFLSRNFRKGMKELLLCSWKKGKGKSSSNSSMHHKRMALQTHSLPTDTTHIGNEQL